MKEIYRKKILLFLQKSGKKPFPAGDLFKCCKVGKSESSAFNGALLDLKREGLVLEQKTGLLLASAIGAFAATVTRVNKNFGFIKRTDDETSVFIPGKFLMGAMPNDLVMAKLIPSRSGSPEGEVVQITEEKQSRFTGTLIEENGQRFILPDSFTKNPIAIISGADGLALGEKVMAEVTVRGARHSDHKATVLSGFGSASKASSCAKSILEINSIELSFPEDVLQQARLLSEKQILPKDTEYRIDLRDTLIFTIDGADTKDIDDAISLKKTNTGYELGVHIADVSHYVKPNTPLDKDAFERGTSIYYANRVVPMLPTELSNGICSLNPNEDRLAFSCLMKIDENGKLVDFEFKKSVIRSRIKGVYSEINSILSGTASADVMERYADCIEAISVANELADILIENKIRRGAPQIETSESKLIINEDDYCTDVQCKARGKSEMIIEEFMLLANQSAATVGRKLAIPFVYRIHDDPSDEKVANLREILLKMGVEIPKFTEIKATHLAQIIENEQGKILLPVVNRLVLRSMAKAKYSTEPVGHFGLVLKDYAHFTSPIRRYPDLSVHRILSEVVKGTAPAAIVKKFGAFAEASAVHSTDRELISVRVERGCEDCYKAEYMSAHMDEVYDGIIGSAVEYGIYVELPNTVEGLVHISNLPDGNYEFDGAITLRDNLSGRAFRVGDSVKIVCVKADVSSGKIDFNLA